MAPQSNSFLLVLDGSDQDHTAVEAGLTSLFKGSLFERAEGRSFGARRCSRPERRCTAARSLIPSHQEAGLMPSHIWMRHLS